MAGPTKPPARHALWLKRQLNAARAASGLSWTAVATAMSRYGFEQTPGNLMNKQSRGSFRAFELLALMQVLGIRSLEPPPNLFAAKSRTKRTADPPLAADSKSKPTPQHQD